MFSSAAWEIALVTLALAIFSEERKLFEITYPSYCAPAVVYADGELELRRQAIVDVNDRDPGFIADVSTPGSLAVQATKHPAASVEIQVHWKGTRAFW